MTLAENHLAVRLAPSREQPRPAAGSQAALALRFCKVLLSSSPFLRIIHRLSTNLRGYRNIARLFRSRANIRAEVLEMREAWTHPHDVPWHQPSDNFPWFKRDILFSGNILREYIPGNGKLRLHENPGLPRVGLCRISLS